MVISKLEQEDLDPPPPYIEDDDYDVYMFYPSISSQILIPVHGAPFVPFEATDSPILAPEGSNNFLPAYRSSASGDESQSLDELGIVLCCLPPLSPTYSSVSDFVHPGNIELENAGYSKLFITGLISKSCGIKRRLNRLRHQVLKALESMKLMASR